MKKEVIAQIHQNSLFSTESINYESDIDQLPNLKNNFITLSTFNPQFEALSAIAEKKAKAYTAHTQKNKKSLSKHTLLIQNRIHQFAIINNDEELKKRTKSTITGLMRLPSSKLNAEAERTLQIANEHASKWEPMNITSNDIDNLANAKEAYKQSIQKSGKIDEAIKRANRKIEKLLKENKKLVRNQIMPTIRIEFGHDKQEIIDTFEGILRETHPHRRKIAVRGKIINAQTGKAVHNALLKLEAIELERRVISKQGDFLIHILDPGTYTFEVSHTLFHTTTFTFKHTWNETTEITIPMDPDPLATEKTKQNQTLHPPQSTETEA